MAIKNISLCLAVLPEFVSDISAAVFWADWRRRLSYTLYIPFYGAIYRVQNCQQHGGA